MVATEAEPSCSTTIRATFTNAATPGASSRAPTTIRIIPTPPAVPTAETRV